VERVSGSLTQPHPGAPPPSTTPLGPRRPSRLIRVGRFGARHGLSVPAFGWTALFFIAPLVILVVYSFGQINFFTLQLHWGWTTENYSQIGQSLYRDAIARSLGLSFAATGSCLVVGYPLAYWISRQPPRRQRLWLLVLIIPFWSSFLVRTYAIGSLLANGGPLESALHTTGLLSGPLNVQYSSLAVGIGIVYSYLPLMVLPLYVALERLDPLLDQSASDLGARPWRVFWRVRLPLSAPGIIAGCILVGIPASGEYVIPTILGGGKTLMYGNLVSTQFLEVGNFPFGSALAVTLMAGVTVFALVARRFSRSAEEIT
jgi:ABC-type spermidine/putrescine transport system permease subunit I